MNASRVIPTLLAAMVISAAPFVGAALGDDVIMSVPSGFVGLSGVVRPGTWTPMRVEIDNQGADTREVRVQWIIPDVDGDQVVAQRRLPLTPRRSHATWLYAVPTMSTVETDRWRVQVIDDRSGRLLAQQSVSIPMWIDARDGMLGVTGAGALGLTYFEEAYTQHEVVHNLRGLDPSRMPDRWYGFSGLEALVWTPDAFDPTSPSVSPESLRAIRDWVQRGGHLVVVLPSVGELWTSSPLNDILPDVKIRPVKDVDPLTIFDLVPAEPMTLLQVNAFDVEAGKASDVMVLHRIGKRGRAGDPVVVAQQRGFGRVTLIGVNLSDPRVVRMGVPSAGDMFWKNIFNWRSPGMTSAQIRSMVDNQQMVDVQLRSGAELGSFVRPLIAMRGTYTAALLAAILVLMFYWLAAGPVGFVVLKHKKMVRHAWLGFVAMIALFSAVTWGGAMVMRPTQSRIEHFTVLDIDAPSGHVRAHSWMSLFVPTHDNVEVHVDRDVTEGNRNTIAAPGLPGSVAESVFLDPQRYVQDSGAPCRLEIPFRSTAKQLEVGWMKAAGTNGSIRPEQDTLASLWLAAEGEISLDAGMPVGQLTHQLPGSLVNVLMVFCRGEDAEPLIWRVRRPWEAGKPVTINHELIAAGGVQPLVRGNRQVWDGFLWMQMGNRPLMSVAQDPLKVISIAEDQIHAGAELLTFHTTLPPPSYWDKITAMGTGPTHYYRALGRSIDLSHLIRSRKLMVIGYLKRSPLPIPLSVDGESVASSGLTVVRWLLPIDGNTAGGATGGASGNTSGG